MVFIKKLFIFFVYYLREVFVNLSRSITSLPYTIKNKRKKRVPFFDKEKFLVYALKDPKFKTSKEYLSPSNSVWWFAMHDQEMYQKNHSFFELKNRKTKYSHITVSESWITWKPLIKKNKPS